MCEDGEVIVCEGFVVCGGDVEGEFGSAGMGTESGSWNSDGERSQTWFEVHH